MASASQGSPSPTPQPDPAPSCRACGHPRPANRTTSYTISSLDKLSNSSTQGCQTCSLLLQGIERYAGDRAEKGDMLVRIEINISGTQCLDIQLLGSPVALSFFVSPSKYLFSSIPAPRWRANIHRCSRSTRPATKLAGMLQCPRGHCI